MSRSGSFSNFWRKLSRASRLTIAYSGHTPGVRLLSFQDLRAVAIRPRPQPNPGLVPYITSNVSKTMTWAPPRRTGQVSAYFAAWSSESASITE